MIRVVLPEHLRTLAKIKGEVVLDVTGRATIASLVDALEAAYPMLRGTVRDHTTRERRAFIRFYVAGEDWSNQSKDTPLPDGIATGAEPLLVVGAMAGG
jgi:sulfur-carrier protein